MTRAVPRLSKPRKFALYLSSGFLNCQFDSGPEIYDWKSIRNCKKTRGEIKDFIRAPRQPGFNPTFFDRGTALVMTILHFAVFCLSIITLSGNVDVFLADAFVVETCDY